MQCMVCKTNVAKVHLTQIVGDKMQKVDLCEACAKEKGVNDPAGFSLADLLLGLGASQEIAQGSDGVELKCPSCGFTQADFKKNGRLGCSECYVTFAEGLESMLKTMHKGTRHAGKVPVALRQKADLSEKIKTLDKKLKDAIKQEDYEAAAKLRDEMNSVKEKLGSVPAR
jgi:protein arginine kinase activator